MSNVNFSITSSVVPASIKSQPVSIAADSQQPDVSTVSAANVPSPAENAVKETVQNKLTTEGIKAAAAVGDNALKAINKDLQFQIDDATKQVVVKIVNSKTGEVVRQIPSVEMLDFIRVMKEQEANTGKLLRAEA